MTRTTLLTPTQPPALWRTAPWGLADAAVGGAVALTASTVVSIIVIAVSLPSLITTSEPVDGEVVVELLLSSGPILAASLLSLWLGLLGAPLVASRWRGNKKLATDFGFTWTPVDIPLGLATAAVLVVMSALVTTLLEGAGIDISDADNASFLTKLPTFWLPFAAVAVAVGAPLIEELFFRGLLLRAIIKTPLLAQRSPATTGAVAIVATSLLFGAAHVSAASIGGLVLFAITGLFGAVFAILAITTGRLGAAIIAHAGVNAFGFSAAVFGS